MENNDIENYAKGSIEIYKLIQNNDIVNYIKDFNRINI